MGADLTTNVASKDFDDYKIVLKGKTSGSRLA